MVHLLISTSIQCTLQVYDLRETLILYLHCFLLTADRAKAIKTTAVVNESPTDKLIRELKEENARLLNMLKSGGGAATVNNQSQDGYTKEGMYPHPVISCPVETQSCPIGLQD